MTGEKEECQTNKCENTTNVIKTVAQFLNKPITDEQVEFIKKYCSFEKMKKNDMTNHSWFKTLGVCTEDGEFIRKGKIGDWATHLTEDLNLGLNKMISLKFRDSNLTFDYHPTETRADTDIDNSSDT